MAIMHMEQLKIMGVLIMKIFKITNLMNIR
jgi:hypothetical protein